MDRIHLSKDKNKWRAIVNMGMKICVQQNARNFMTSYATSNISRRALLHWFICLFIYYLLFGWLTGWLGN